MALITYILIAIPVCLLAIILWLYFNYWKYKRKNHFILLILLFYPVLSYAQYMDKTQCKISFSSHANQAGKLEYTQDGIIYRFTPESNAWKITIKNNTNKNARINWEKGSFIIYRCNAPLPPKYRLLLLPRKCHRLSGHGRWCVETM